MSTHPVLAIYRDLDAKRDRPALYDGDVALTHGALIERVEAAAAAIGARVAPGARVGLCAANTWRHVVAYLAIMRAGAVWVPLNPRNGPTLNGEFARRAGLDLVLCDAESDASLDQRIARVSLEAFLDAAPSASPPPLNAGSDDTFAIKFTGGSTGVPKGVVQTVRSGARAMASLEAFYGFNADEVNLAVAPLTHGSSHYVIPVLAAGGAHVLMARPDRAAMLDELKRRVSIVFMPPTLIQLLMSEAHFTPQDFPRLRHLTYSAAPMAPAAIERAIERFGPVLSTVYGQTEAPMTITGLQPYELQRPELRASVGRAFAGTDVAVLTAEGGIEPRGEGEVIARGDLAASSYLDDPAQTEASRHDGWLKTGDIGRIDENGYLYLNGRSKEMIITGGYNVYPAEVERALAAHPAVSEACAFAVADEVWGERLEAAVCAADANEAALLSFVRDQLGPVRTPKRLHFLAALPRNPVGKVVRTDVRDLIYETTSARQVREEQGA